MVIFLGGGEAVFLKMFFLNGLQGVLSISISPKRACDGEVKRRDRLWESGLKKTSSGQKRPHLGKK